MNIKVRGGQRLSGTIIPSGSKNSAVALLPASILFDRPIEFSKIPEITDVVRLVSILKKLGSKIEWNKRSQKMVIDNRKLTLANLDQEDLGNMRGTSLLWGPMLARFGKVIFEKLPGGCTLGLRTLRPHYQAFSDFGVTVKEKGDGIGMNATRAKSAKVLLAEMSPTVTENTIMLATGLKGKTIISGAASEPQVQDLCHLLIKAGAKIKGVGSNVLTVEGGYDLEPKKHKLLSDHYEIATFLALGAATGGRVELKDALPPDLFLPIKRVFENLGAEIINKDNSVVVKGGQKLVISSEGTKGTLYIKAQPWPALPVDALPLFIPLALAAKHGHVVFHNWMYEAGLFWTTELHKLGANIIINDPHRVTVIAGNKLVGAQMEAPYIIRAVVAMVMAGMIASGETEILNADALYRGHPRFSKNLKKLGAKIKEV